jgi:hypothetical protein
MQTTLAKVCTRCPGMGVFISMRAASAALLQSCSDANGPICRVAGGTGLPITTHCKEIRRIQSKTRSYFSITGLMTVPDGNFQKLRRLRQRLHVFCVITFA